MLLMLLIGSWVMLLAARGTPLGAMLHRALVAAPAARLLRIQRGQVLLWLVLGGASAALIGVMAEEGRMLVAFGLPDVVAMAGAIDLASMLDLALVAVVAAGSVRVRAIRAWLRPRSAGRPRVRAVRTRPAARPERGANDDEDRPALAA